MKWIRNVAVALVVLSFADSCIRQPEYSNVPRIDLVSIVFKKTATVLNPFDTIVFTLTFKDGDGDLGLDPDETDIYPTNSSDPVDVADVPFYFVYDTIQNQILGTTHDNDLNLSNEGQNLSYVDYHAKLTHPYPLDTLPDLSCDGYEYPSTTGGQSDTLYYISNINAKNIFVKAYIKSATDTSHTLYNPNVYFAANGFTESCSSSNNFLNGRFPVLSSDLGNKSPLDGTIIYKYPSAGLYPFYGQTVRFTIYITDRTYDTDQGRFQRSNIIQSRDYKF